LATGIAEPFMLAGSSEIGSSQFATINWPPGLPAEEDFAAAAGALAGAEDVPAAAAGLAAGLAPAAGLAAAAGADGLGASVGLAGAVVGAVVGAA